jgi:hypothetical protein
MDERDGNPSGWEVRSRYLQAPLFLSSVHEIVKLLEQQNKIPLAVEPIAARFPSFTGGGRGQKSYQKVPKKLLVKLQKSQNFPNFTMHTKLPSNCTKFSNKIPSPAVKGLLPSPVTFA